jgi:hypothetical protein
MRKLGLTMYLVLAATLALGFFLASCASIPKKRVDTVLNGADEKDLGAKLAEASIAAGPAEADIDRVVRELFPVAASQLGLVAAATEGRAEYAIWLHEEEYAVGIDTYSAVLCVLKLRSKVDGSAFATTVVADDTKLKLSSSGYIYALLREALRSLAGTVSDSAKAMKAKKAAAK